MPGTHVAIAFARLAAWLRDPLFPGLLLIAVAGCGEASPPVHSAAVRASVTPADPTLATSDYWWDQPAVARVADGDFVRLWNACEAEARARFMRVDREDYRLGLLTTVPLVTKQIFEPWRTDAVNLHDVTESTLATIRRTVRFEIAKRPDGTFEMVPKVLVDRFTSAERRLTAINQYHQAFSGPRAFADSPDLSGDVTVEHGAAEYWYPLHRDPALEQNLADAIRARLAAGAVQEPVRSPVSSGEADIKAIPNTRAG